MADTLTTLRIGTHMTLTSLLELLQSTRVLRSLTVGDLCLTREDGASTEIASMARLVTTRVRKFRCGEIVFEEDHNPGMSELMPVLWHAMPDLESLSLEAGDMHNLRLLLQPALQICARLSRLSLGSYCVPDLQFPATLRKLSLRLRRPETDRIEDVCIHQLNQLDWRHVLALCKRLRCFKFVGSEWYPAPARLVDALAASCPRLDRLVIKCTAVEPGFVSRLVGLRRMHRLHCQAVEGSAAEEWMAALPECHFLRLITVSDKIGVQGSLFALCEQLGITLVEPF
jgi:hypothetical protein